MYKYSIVDVIIMLKENPNLKFENKFGRKCYRFINKDYKIDSMKIIEIDGKEYFDLSSEISFINAEHSNWKLI
jgi:hypothetical protein